MLEGGEWQRSWASTENKLDAARREDGYDLQGRRGCAMKLIFYVVAKYCSKFQDALQTIIH